MSKQIKGIILSRLMVLISIILVPIIVFLIFTFLDFTLWFSNDSKLTFWTVKVLCPVIFSLSWLFFLILFATRLSTTIESMDKTIGVVPLRLKLFFGINAIFVLFIFIFPLITPLISVLSFTSMAWRLTTFRRKDWEEEKVSIFTKIIMGIASILPLYCSICIIPSYVALAVFLWFDVWLVLLDTILLISYCLCTALAIGSFVALVSHKGVSEYEELNEPDKTHIDYRVVALEGFLFGFFLFLAIYGFESINLFFNLGFIFVVIVSIVNFVKGRQKNSKFKGHLFGYILAAVFLGSHLLYINNINSQFWGLVKVISLFVSSATFIFVLFYTFLKHEETVF